MPDPKNSPTRYHTMKLGNAEPFANQFTKLATSVAAVAICVAKCADAI